MSLILVDNEFDAALALYELINNAGFNIGSDNDELGIWKEKVGYFKKQHIHAFVLKHFRLHLGDWLKKVNKWNKVYYMLTTITKT